MLTHCSVVLCETLCFYTDSDQCSEHDTRVSNFLKYDTDFANRLTLANFLALYRDSCINNCPVSCADTYVNYVQAYTIVHVSAFVVLLPR
jgi:hypothetical protein